MDNYSNKDNLESLNNEDVIMNLENLGFSLTFAKVK